MDQADNPSVPSGLDPFASRRVWLGMMALLAFGLVMFGVMTSFEEPPPPEIAKDPLLVRGREIFLERCVSCHGAQGRGDGPLAKGLTGPAPRNLVEDPWKFGDRPEQVLAVLEDGVKDAQMPAWGGTYGTPDLKSVAAYVYHLGGRPIPDSLRDR
ncbi:c-type cytochrome [Tundrisphaera lichenicola]|uniref:c-type cytochrome n=1 Tax=Tundrisphaera lichenicola TaxID=2029860 RepID=UPI003EBFA0D7